MPACWGPQVLAQAAGWGAVEAVRRCRGGARANHKVVSTVDDPQSRHGLAGRTSRPGSARRLAQCSTAAQQGRGP